jgi:hypothetical protein
MATKKFCKRPYYKTDQGVLVKLKDEPMEMKPRKTFKRLMDEAGGPLHDKRVVLHLCYKTGNIIRFTRLRRLPGIINLLYISWFIRC